MSTSYNRSSANSSQFYKMGEMYHMPWPVYLQNIRSLHLQLKNKSSIFLPIELTKLIWKSPFNSPFLVSYSFFYPLFRFSYLFFGLVLTFLISFKYFIFHPLLPEYIELESLTRTFHTLLLYSTNIWQKQSKGSEEISVTKLT